MLESKSVEQKSHHKTGKVEAVHGATQQETGPDAHQQGKVSTVKKATKAVDRTLFCRHEIKYRITESKAAAVEQFIRPYLQLDRYSKLRRDRSYPIVSLYLDTENMLLCRQTLRGHKNRFKLRIRSYTDEPGYPRFFEIKRRMNTIIIKNRGRVRDQDVVTLLSGSSLPPQEYHTDEKTLSQFQLYMKSINAKPKVLIRYLRQAYEDTSHNRIRVTFDRELCYNVTKSPKVLLNGHGWQRHPISRGGVILEIKFTARYPAWLSHMVGCLNLRQESFSKFATSITSACSLGFCAPELLLV
jgi:SPX domain protein involved in polyphosphate accumulation